MNHRKRKNLCKQTRVTYTTWLFSNMEDRRRNARKKQEPPTKRKRNSKGSSSLPRSILDRYAVYFPLNNPDSVVELLTSQLTDADDAGLPDLTLLSIVFGIIENALTISNGGNVGDRSFPTIQLQTVSDLYERFLQHVMAVTELGPDVVQNNKKVGRTKRVQSSARTAVKKVSDAVWSLLTSSYHKDKPHMHTIYSLLTDNKLDSFGVTLAVVAACQLLGLDDVHLAVAEAHSWVVFGEDALETAEVTWHGKGVEDKRGESVASGVADQGWMYLSGHAVVCTRQMEVVALVCNISSHVNSCQESAELALLKKRLLWILYDRGYMNRFPVSLISLAELETILPSSDRMDTTELLQQSVSSGKTCYGNMHVYPYIFLGKHYFDDGKFKHALRTWADAAEVVSKYNYCSNDEEVYKKFLEIGNDLIPRIVKKATEAEKTSPDELSILQDADCFAQFLRFYDGICGWEEGSSTPVLHITWAKHMWTSLSKFCPAARDNVLLLIDAREVTTNIDRSSQDSRFKEGNEISRDFNGNTGTKSNETTYSDRLNKSLHNNKKNASGLQLDKEVAVPGSKHSRMCNEEESFFDEECRIKLTIEELASRFGEDSGSYGTNPEMAALAHACSESILNPDYFRGGGEPFAPATTSSKGLLESTLATSYLNFEGENDICSLIKNELDSDDPDLSRLELDPLESSKEASEIPENDSTTEYSSIVASTVEKVELVLQSTKMKAMRDLLSAKKLNANAIKLQLTAQSQVFPKHSHLKSEVAYDRLVKRLRRE